MKQITMTNAEWSALIVAAGRAKKTVGPWRPSRETWTRTTAAGDCVAVVAQEPRLADSWEARLPTAGRTMTGFPDATIAMTAADYVLEQHGIESTVITIDRHDGAAAKPIPPERTRYLVYDSPISTRVEPMPFVMPEPPNLSIQQVEPRNDDEAEPT
jgi:hypothetical protein